MQKRIEPMLASNVLVGAHPVLKPHIYMRRICRRICKKQDVDMLTWAAGEAEMLEIHCFFKQNDHV